MFLYVHQYKITMLYLIKLGSLIIISVITSENSINFNYGPSVLASNMTTNNFKGIVITFILKWVFFLKKKVKWMHFPWGK